MAAENRKFQIWVITPEGRYLVTKKTSRLPGRKQSEFTENEAISLRDRLRREAQDQKKAFYIRELH